MPSVGHLAAVATSLCWSTNAVFFTLAGRRVGSPVVNVTRLVLALVAMLVLNGVMFGVPLPWHLGIKAWGWLSLSGLIGFALGDALLFEAFVRLGPRLGTLVATVWPAFAACMAWPLFGEALTFTKGLAILITLGGLALVVAGSRSSGDSRPHPHHISGVFLALGGAVGQATGVILSKLGMQEGIHPVEANGIRVVAGVVVLLGWTVLRGEVGNHVRKLLADRTSTWQIALGALAGPVLGVVLSLYAIKAIHTGVASTLMSLAPVILLPVSRWLFKEAITPRTLLGTALTLGGVVALFLA